MRISFFVCVLRCFALFCRAFAVFLLAARTVRLLSALCRFCNPAHDFFGVRFVRRQISSCFSLKKSLMIFTDSSLVKLSESTHFHFLSEGSPP